MWRFHDKQNNNNNSVFPRRKEKKHKFITICVCFLVSHAKWYNILQYLEFKQNILMKIEKQFDCVILKNFMDPKG